MGENGESMAKGRAESRSGPGGVLALEVEGRLVPMFFQFLGKGFVVRTDRELTLRSFLKESLGMQDDYIEGRIQTLLLDGRPVDDVDRARVRRGATLALSAAMPGLLGAVLRKAGYYRKMRDSISHRETEEKDASAGGDVLVKLFNLVAREKGPALLERGVWIPRSDAAEFFSAQPQMFWEACRRILWNGAPADREDLIRLPGKGGGLILKVTGA
ncbi:MAG: hypothetical protein JRF59_08350 [Deltaproteobacteria bacterium]|nr:hypothetical protein [Deltaproteobacteria bacterium]MBW1949766.1 hypothetical protein [Deltaproteobacteria bacterium]MBW2347838.1 hypothetical protein [Deltaproteobacteria bacterium]